MPFGPESPGTRCPEAGAGDAGGAAGLKVAPGEVGAAAFSPFQPGAGAHPATTGAGGGGGAVVSLRREGGRIVGIRVECACGQVVELACSY